MKEQSIGGVAPESGIEEAKVLRERGFECLGTRDYAHAVAHFEGALRLDPLNAQAHLGHGQACHYLDDTEKALSSYNEAIRLDPGLARAYLNRGSILFSQGRHEEALADYGETIRLRPGEYYGYFYRGLVYLHLQRFEEALGDLNEALRIQPQSADAHYQRACAYQRLGDLDCSLSDLDSALRLNPGLMHAYRLRASIWQEKGNQEKANEDAEAVFRLQTSTAETTNMNRKALISSLLQEHFSPAPIESLTITERTFPRRVRADLQAAIDQLSAPGSKVGHFSGILQHYAHEGLKLSGLLVPNPNDPAVVVPAEYEEVDIGEEEPVRCLKNGLWLVDENGSKFAVLVAPAGQGGWVTGLKFQIATVNDSSGARLTQEFFRHLENAVLKSGSYRGKILSLERAYEYAGTSTGITVHRLRSVSREQVILPRRTLDLLDRNIIHFARRRSRLAELGLSTKKGILFWGPPGTGKTHTIHYLASALERHTTFLITAEQFGLLEEYMTLARLLQPSLVVLEDVDLIARDRSDKSSCSPILLHKLLNEMDGLKADAEVTFILTTNRPEILEPALVARPGRIDQSIEFPLPDDEGRSKLVRLYSYGLEVTDELSRDIVLRTQNVSASFIKELMRRAAQFHLERDGSPRIDPADVNSALEELLLSGSLNRRLLGAASEAPAGG